MSCSVDQYLMTMAGMTIVPLWNAVFVIQKHKTDQNCSNNEEKHAYQFSLWGQGRVHHLWHTLDTSNLQVDSSTKGEKETGGTARYVIGKYNYST
mmetsp:Transcript_24026/g.36628  ORF Transcript_24026/g.36628 Transcript_24026/m.36628 type:complete len:95 (+) Transcript_24026:112-396(+)